MIVRKAREWVEVRDGKTWECRELPSVTKQRRGWWIFQWWQTVEVVTA